MPSKTRISDAEEEDEDFDVRDFDGSENAFEEATEIKGRSMRSL